MSRHIYLTCALACGLATAQPALAQPSTPSASSAWTGSVDLGGRVTSVSGDPARYQRFRDLRTGPWFDAAHLERRTDRWTLDVSADKVGYRDQHYLASVRRDGRVQLSFEWDSVPLFVSRDTATLHTSTAPGRLEIDDAIQVGLQTGQFPMASVIGRALAFETRSRRDTATFRLTVTPQRDLDLSILVRTATRRGTQPWGAPFSLTNTVEIAAPIDHRTTDASVIAEWASDRGSARLGYDGSWFDNAVETLRWDNPFRATDAVDGPVTGQAALWPSSMAHSVHLTGAVKLPARSLATAFVSVGQWDQDGALLPFTTNTALTGIGPRQRDTAQAKARITAMSYAVTTRPVSSVWMNARYRLYDFDNRTPAFSFLPNYVRYDSTVVTPPVTEHSPFGYTRQFVDLDTSFTPWKYAAIRLGYALEHDDRTGRYVETTDDHVVKVSVDSMGFARGSVRAVYEYSKRVGSGFDEEALDEIGEHVSLRQFDISDRNRQRVTLVGTVNPLDSLGVTTNIGIGRDRRPDAEFGLRDNDHDYYTVGVDWTPTATAGASVTYGYEHYTTLQRSRQANPGVQFDDPTRDWATDGEDRVHTLAASIELPDIAPRLSLEFGYDLSSATTQYRYALAADTTLPAVNQLPRLLAELHQARAAARYRLTSRARLNASYGYDRYLVDDFQQGPATLNRRDLPGGTYLGYLNRPYTGHSGWAGITFLW